MPTTPNRKRGAGPAGGRPTMRDVAALASVSTMTVSRVLRDDPGTSRQTREKVLEAVDVLGYRLNENARTLRLGRGSGLIALIVSNLANPFYSRLATGVESVLERHGLLTVIGSAAEDPARETALAKAFAARRVEGFIVVPVGSGHDHLLPPQVGGSPVVLATRPPTGGLEADCVLVDDHGGSFALTARLLAEGHRRIGFLGNLPAGYTSTERLRGFHDAHRAAGVPVDPVLVAEAPSDAGRAEEAAAALLNAAAPTAMLCANNRNTLATLRAARRTGHEVAVAGFDELEAADLIEAPLLLGAYAPEEVGRRAASLLLDRLGGAVPAGGSPRTAVVPVTTVAYGKPLRERAGGS